MHDHGRWIATALMRVAQLDAAAQHGRRRVRLDRTLQLACQLRGWQRAHRRLIGLAHILHDDADCGAVARRNEMQRRVIQERQLQRYLVAHLLARMVIESVPLVDRNHQRATVLSDQAHQARILLADVGLRIDDGHDDMRALDCLQRLDDRELLDGLPDTRLAADAGSVHQHVRLAVVIEGYVDRIARRSRHIGGEHALLSDQTIHQRRFADVRPADNGDTDAAIVLRRFRRYRRKILENLL